jgi:NADH dehydrogenase
MAIEKIDQICGLRRTAHRRSVAFVSSADRSSPARVVIVGGGFGGLFAARALADAPVAVTLIDRSNHHLFQPLLYQVALAALSPAEIAVPIRSILGNQRNTTVLMAEVQSIDIAARETRIDGGEVVPYDYLILAAGAQTNYYGHAEWQPYAPSLKNIEDAIDIRRRVLVALERAERTSTPEQRAELLTFVVIGGGPTGVELAGAIAELASPIATRDFKRIDPSAIRVILIEAGERILASFDPELSEKGAEQLRELGVIVQNGRRVTRIDDRGVWLGDELIPSQSVLWTAGVRPNPLAATLGVPLDRSGRVVVGPDCAVPGHPNVFAIGDIACFTPAGQPPLPGVSPVAMQQARHVAATIAADLRGDPRQTFHYVDKGTMATIGRRRAVAQIGNLHLSGLLAWLAWLFVHLWYLIGFRNRLAVFTDWCWSYLSFRHGARLITGHSPPPTETRPPASG